MSIQTLSSLSTAVLSTVQKAGTPPPGRRQQLTVDPAPADSPWWEDSGDVWDTVRIAGITLPGVATVSGKGFEQRTDRRVIPGQKGKRMTTFGCDPADIEIELQLWEPEHLEGLKALIAVIKPRDGKAQAVSIYHPGLDLYQIRSVLVLSATVPTMKRSVMGVTIRCVEHVAETKSAPVAKVVQKADVPGSMGPGTYRNDYVTKLDAEAARNAQKPSSSPDAAAP
jgi:hypothetical protein